MGVGQDDGRPAPGRRAGLGPSRQRPPGRGPAPAAPCAEIWRADGEAAFRRLEAEALAEALASAPTPDGHRRGRRHGARRRRTAGSLRQRRPVVWLRADRRGRSPTGSARATTGRCSTTTRLARCAGSTRSGARSTRRWPTSSSTSTTTTRRRRSCERDRRPGLSTVGVGDHRPGRPRRPVLRRARRRRAPATACSRCCPSAPAGPRS